MTEVAVSLGARNRARVRASVWKGGHWSCGCSHGRFNSGPSACTKNASALYGIEDDSDKDFKRLNA